MNRLRRKENDWTKGIGTRRLLKSYVQHDTTTRSPIDPNYKWNEKASPLYLILSNSWIKQLLFIACQVNKKANKSQVPNNRHNLPPFELIFHSPARCFFLSLFVTPIRTRTVHVRIVHVDTLARNCRWPFYSADVLKLFRFIFALTSR